MSCCNRAQYLQKWLFLSADFLEEIVTYVYTLLSSFITKGSQGKDEYLDKLPPNSSNILTASEVDGTNTSLRRAFC